MDWLVIVAFHGHTHLSLETQITHSLRLKTFILFSQHHIAKTDFLTCG